MIVVRRRLFWKIYMTLLASLVAANIFMGAFFWFLSEAQHEGSEPASSSDHVRPGPGDVTVYAADGKMIDSRGRRIAPSEASYRWHGGPGHVQRIDLPDGRFVLARFGPSHGRKGFGILAIMLIVFSSVGLAAYPVTALLTRRLEVLRAGVARWGDGETPIRLDDRGNDEVALLAGTFNAAAARIDAMLAAQKALLANASHELRSPLARLRVAVEVASQDKAAPHGEIVQNLAEMDQLVDELLLASRLDHPGAHPDRRETIDVLGLAAEEAARCDAVASGTSVDIIGDTVLLRRLVRNLLENGVKHGGPPVTIAVARCIEGAEIVVSDSGKGINPEDRQRIFEPFYRPAGFGESSGGYGLGLALVRQIAERHRGSVECRDSPSGGSRFVVRLAGIGGPTAAA